MILPKEFDYKEAFSEENFFFGVAVAPYLSEGGFNYPNGIKNVYAELELTGKIEKTGEATKFWTNYEEHIKLAASLGLNAFRMGIAWSRIQPTTSLEPHSPPEWDYNAVDHYVKIIRTIMEYGMEPIITLHHFSHPAWLRKDMWLNNEGPALFVTYALKIVEEINIRLTSSSNRVIEHFLVYNEPNLVPLMFFMTPNFSIKKQGPRYIIKAYDNMFSSYVKVYDGIYNLFQRQKWGTPHVGFNICSQCAYELDKLFLDLMRMRIFKIEEKNLDIQLKQFRTLWNIRIEKLARRQLDKKSFRNYQDLIKMTHNIFHISGFKKTVAALYNSPRDKKLDYISVNIYEPFSIPKGSLDGTNLPQWWEYAMDREIYGTFIRAYNELNFKLPFYMGENSIAYKQPKGGIAKPRPDGWSRERYLKEYLSEMILCMSEGIPIKGYLYWSLTDDYEWNSYEPRLGLYNYDYINSSIKETDGLGEPAGKIYAELIAALRSGSKDEIFKNFSLYKYKSNS
ncbi:MAG: putative Glycoside hydrolase family 1 [Promethearchaeota archaeon]|nr:MAG: putative Glycoside hydrolase family 1 [Candidatus Lokiarchaeota archaeon]